ncbi:MAG TPA: serine/threonine-protein kinase [Polyangia bacterium]|nr:serine/threonine-protein kinase [Polyangia bacterium]
MTACLDLTAALAFVSGRGTFDARAEIVAHLEGCATCRELVMATRPHDWLEETAAADGATPRPREAATPRARAPEVPISRGTQVGRYTILDVIGRGGFGEVYAAYDPELDRKIAIKFLRPTGQGSSPNDEAKLLREAKAIAKLSHPNVVTVYDAGTFGARVFVAMEFVDGATLRDWAREAQRSRAEILAVFERAARGLGAAHEVGLVHRDFKPSNVMVRKDGHVFVMDFGRVRQITDAEESPGGGAELGTAGETDLDLTRTGEIVGTPAYMAPEQLEGERTDARTDQFSFCVALYGALYGERPFDGDTLFTIRDNVLAGRVRPPPEKTTVPTWIRRVLLRGLSIDPARRYPSMDALVAALAHDPARRRRRQLALAATAVAGLAVALGVSRHVANVRATCAAGPARLAGAWEPGGVDSPRKEEIRAAFTRTGKSYAALTYARTASLLDAYADRWVAMFRDACEATRVRGEQSEDALRLREACLDDRARDLRALTDVYARADVGVVHNAISAATALPALEACADLAALRAGGSAFDAKTRGRDDGFRDRFARVQALLQSGQCAAAGAEGRPLLDDLRAAKLRPLLAQTLALMGTLSDDCGEARESIAWLKEAYFTAEAARLDRLAAEAAARIPVLAVNRLGDAKTARDWLEIMRATLERTGPDDRLQSMLASAEALVADAADDRDAAIAAARRALDLSRRALGPDHVQTLLVFTNLGVELANGGHVGEALSVYREADDATVRALGPEHPALGNLANNECEALNTLGRHAEAATQCRRAIDIWIAAGADEATVSFGRTGLGIALLGLGRPEDAIAPLETALHDRVERDVAPRWIAETRFALARALWSRPADHERARALAQQARVGAAGVDAKMASQIDTWLAKPS